MEESTNSLLDFLNAEKSQISITDFMIHIVLAAALSVLLGLIYTRYGNSLSNRKALAGTIVLISITTMIIISIVKSSLALSLGLVGALSIVRFRTAIKDPEELSYFFIAIAIGLGMGAGQALITICGSLFIFVFIFLRRISKSKDVIQNLSLTVLQPKDFDYEKLVKTLGEYCSQLELRRLDENEESVEISFFVRFKSFERLLESKKAIQKIDSRIQFSYLENI